jgi:hypothetical protein
MVENACGDRAGLGLPIDDVLSVESIDADECLFMGIIRNVHFDRKIGNR